MVNQNLVRASLLLVLGGCGVQPFGYPRAEDALSRPEGDNADGSVPEEGGTGPLDGAGARDARPDLDGPLLSQPQAMRDGGGADVSHELAVDTSSDAPADVSVSRVMPPPDATAADRPALDRAGDGMAARHDSAPDARPDLAADVAPPAMRDVAPDLPADLAADAPADLAPDLTPDLPPDLAPDLAPDLSPDLEPAVCGNGVRQPGEACDDGNPFDDDACSNDCTLPRCGDGITQPGEQCDDGNAGDDDRCTASCTWVPFTQIVAGACGLRRNGMVTCWDGAPVPPALRFSSIAPNFCGLRTDGRIACWGETGLPPTGTYSQVAAGTNFVCGIRLDGTLRCTGPADFVPPVGKFTRVSALVQSACAVRADGRLLCWGLDPPVTDKTKIPAGSTFAEVAVGQGVACAFTTNGTASCWGIDTPDDLISVSMSFGSACGVRRDGTAICWTGADGTSNPVTFPGPFQRVAGFNVLDLCGLRPDGTIDCGFRHESRAIFSPTAPPVRSLHMFDADSPLIVHARGSETRPACGATRDQPCWDLDLGHGTDICGIGLIGPWLAGTPAT